MDPNLRLAWTRIVTVEDYEQHMSAIGQAQAAATLTEFMIRTASPPEHARLLIVGAGTGQMFDFLDPALFRPFHIICTDLNSTFLDRLDRRLTAHGITATLLEDDIEHSGLEPGADLLLATLLLEHIDWRRGLDAIAELRPRACGIIMQENPAGMQSAITPGRQIPPSIAKAMETAHPVLVPQDELATAFNTRGYSLNASRAQEVADAKRLIALLFTPSAAARPLR
jgi:hypothetical protein